MNLRYAVNDKGERVLMRSAKDAEGKQHWLPYPESKAPKKILAKLNGKEYVEKDGQQGRRQAKSEAARANANAADQRQWEDTVAKGASAIERKKMARDMPFYEKFAIQSMLETQKLGAGAMNIADFLQDAFTPGGSDSALARTAQRRIDQKEKDIMDEQLHQEAGLAKTGAAVPYLISGQYGTKPAEALAAKAISIPAKGVATGAKATGGVLGRAVRRAARSNRLPGPVKQAAGEIESNVMNPFLKEMARVKARPSITPPGSESVLKTLGGAATLGAVEGGMHYDTSALEGAGASTLGAGLGRFLGRYLEPIAPRTTESEKEILDWWKDQGYRTDAGMESGQPKVQRRMDSLRADPKYSQYMHDFDMANEKTVTEVAGRAAGFKPEELNSITEGKLKDHMQMLREEYQKMEADTLGRFENRDLTALNTDLSKASKDLRPKINSFYEKMQELIKPPTRDARGRFQKGTFSGNEYQKLRADLKQASNDAWGGSNRELAGYLDKMIGFMDSGIEEGMKLGGKYDPKLWKDLNERYAMSKILIDHGLTPSGRIDSKKISNHLMSKDSERTLQGKGGRITELQKIAKLQDVVKGQSKGGLGKTDVELDSRSYDLSSMSSPVKLQTTPFNKLRADLQVQGYPFTRGFANPIAALPPMYKQGATQKLGRATAQGYHAHSPALSLMDYLQDEESNLVGSTIDYWMEALAQ